MNKNGEIIFVEDDLDDQEVFQQAYQDLGIPNRLVMFSDAQKAYEYFNNTKKDLFLIISDINMPIMTGIQLRDKMQQVGEVRLRNIPCLFMTTGTAPNNILYAYSHSVQGFFQKPSNYTQLKTVLKHIYDYWNSCTEPIFSNRPPQSL
jgi:CheY-like chemotaxis protein